MPQNSKNRFIILDSNALIHRAWHALPPLQTKSGELVNAVYGFLLILFKVMRDLKPDYLVATFDVKGPTFRHEAFKEYKAQRIKQPDEFYAQIPMVKEALAAFNIKALGVQGFEADDLIGTLTKQAEGKGSKIEETIVVTGDLDTLQLVSNKTKILTLKRGVTDTVLYDEAAVKERYGLVPSQMIDYKAMRGDPSDNIPGVPGIGEVTATALLKEFGSIEKMYEAVHAGAKNKVLTAATQKKLLEHEKEIEPNKMLVTIVRDVPIDITPEDCRWQGYDREKVVEVFQKLEFLSLLNKIPANPGEKSKKETAEKAEEKKTDSALSKSPYQIVTDVAEAKEVIKEMKQYLNTDRHPGQVQDPINRIPDKSRSVRDPAAAVTGMTERGLSLYIDADGEFPVAVTLGGLAISWEAGIAYYFDLTNKEILAELKTVLEDEKIKKIGHNLKEVYEALKTRSIELKGMEFDTMIASYLLNPGSRQHELASIVFNRFAQELKNIEVKGQARIGESGKEKEALCERADYILQLIPKLKAELTEQNLEKLFNEVEIPLIEVLAQVELNGVKLDSEFLAEFSERIGKKLASLEKKIHVLAGSEFNVNSPLQLKEILFEKLKISTQGIGKTKTGLSTASEELEKMRDLHPIIPLVVDYRELAKLQNTYLLALPKLVNQKTQRLHTSFNQTVTATGRLSSSNPNLQNIPIRTELGQEVRKAFIADKGCKLVSLDYAQIELRIIASLANDEKMLAAFRHGEDIHIRTAAEAYGVEIKDVTPAMRRVAKTVNFGIIYGLGSVGLAQATDLTRAEARDFIDRYFKVYTGVANYIKETKELAATLGYVETLFGRRRYLPEINSSVQMVRAQAERMAVNMPVQGTSADMIKMAMIKIHHGLLSKKFNAKMILQVHDELVFEVADKEVDDLSAYTKEVMENVVKIKVPIEVHVKVGKNWGEMAPLK